LGGRNGERLHAEKDEKGRSVVAMKTMEKLHKGKDERGKSIHSVKAGKERAKTLNSEIDGDGKSTNAVKGGKTTSQQVWESTVDGFRSSAGNVARHNKAQGWNPNARVKISG
jgi:hypothetical protein